MCLDVSLHLFYGERGGAAFECCDEVLAEDVSACGVMRDFLEGIFGVVRVAHQAEVLPDDFLAGANVEAGEVRVERAPALNACGGGIFR